MIGKISKYDSLNEMGYIVGYDELTYFYHQNNVIGNKQLKEGDIVCFDYRLEKNENQLPYAINIIKEKKPKGLKSYKELYEIIKKLPEKEKNKIPNSFLEQIKNNMDKNYSYKVEHIEDFENQEMLEETKRLLALVYRDYLASEEEKNKILQKEKEELNKEELEKREKYDVDVFAKQKVKAINEIEKNQNTENLELIVKEEKTWFSKFVDFIKKIFKK